MNVDELIAANFHPEIPLEEYSLIFNNKLHKIDNEHSFIFPIPKENDGLITIKKHKNGDFEIIINNYTKDEMEKRHLSMG